MQEQLELGFTAFFEVFCVVKVRLVEDSTKRRHECINRVFTKEWTEIPINESFGLLGSLDLEIKFQKTDEDDLLNLDEGRLNLLTRSLKLKNGNAASIVKQMFPVKKSGLKTKAVTTAKKVKETVL